MISFGTFAFPPLICIMHAVFQFSFPNCSYILTDIIHAFHYSMTGWAME
ncbi:MAG: hypothetical protein ACI3XW_04160 [Butyricicoccus sp.]